ncbi:MAG TPA: (deoxy)nucleoside triphosphate pyrophosphohydrolase [Lacunisphaera sp.]
MPSPVSIPVVCALIERDGCLLLAQRPPNKHLPLKWEFPGGKVEPDEAASAAVVREIKEELSCEIVIRRALPSFLHDYKTVVIEMLPFVCQLAPQSSAPTANEHVALAWVKPDDLARYDLAAADLPIIALYR